MVKLEALTCSKCGSPLGKFENGLFKCDCCSTFHVLVGVKSSKITEIYNSGSIFVEIPPAIAIGKLLRSNSIKAGNNYSPTYHPRFHSGTLKTELVNCDFLNIALSKEVAKVRLIDDPSKKGLRALLGRRIVEEYNVEVAFIPFLLDLDVKEEAPFILIVHGEKYMDKAIEIAKLINKELGYSIKVRIDET